jgi:hypothetical protein
MNTFDFLARYGAALFIATGNDAVADVHRWLNTALDQPSGKTSRVTSTWAVVSEEGVEMKQRFVPRSADSVVFSDDAPSVAFARHLAFLSGPKAFLIFEKKPLDLKQMFLTFDLRMARVCTPRGAITFDATRAPGAAAAPIVKAIWKARAKAPEAA